AVSTDGRFAITGGYDGRLRLWGLTGEQKVRVFAGHSGPVHSVAFSANGKFVLSGSADKTARVWNVKTGEEICRLPHSSTVSSVAFSFDGQFILTADENEGTAKLWAVRTCRHVRDIKTGVVAMIESVAFSPDSRLFVAGGFNG